MQLTLTPQNSTLVVIDLQGKLVPALDGAQAMVENAKRLIAGAEILSVPLLFTEQNPAKLGPTIPELARPSLPAISKMSFGAVPADGFMHRLAGKTAVICGCEAHVCVLQTALALLEAGRQVFVVRDAISSRRAESKDTAIRRMEKHGAEIVTTEMVLFEWLGTAEHPRFRDISALVK